ncbi:MAG: Hpt domain-containing protein, partial [Candidatus Fermentibacteria bacterium]
MTPTEELEAATQAADLTPADTIDLSLLQDFLVEAGEHLAEMESGLLQLEADPDGREILNDIFRSVHTIKGAAEFVGLERISELSHKLENLLELLRQGQEQVSRDIIDTLIEARDRISLLVEDLQRSQTEEAAVDDLVGRIARLAESGEETDEGRIYEEPEEAAAGRVGP